MNQTRVNWVVEANERLPMPKKPTASEQLEFAQLRAFVATSFEDCASMSLSAESA